MTLRRILAIIAIALGLAFLIGAALGLGMRAAKAQDEHQHVHPTETITGPTAKFYETWMKPDAPHSSCCNKADCYSTEARFEGGHWMARRREDGKWLKIPPQKVEQLRDSPDGLSHMCAPPPNASYPPDTVFCFKAGGGA